MMDQAGLRKLEAQCIQEEPPRCMAACPLHVDARKLCLHGANGKWDDAWAVLARTMPLPGVLARICDEPCRQACVRSLRGGSLEMAALERYAAENATRTPKAMALPSKGKHIHVFGGGLAGLSAASDLLRKGFAVTLFSADPAQGLRALPEDLLPQSVLDAEFDRLRTMGLTVAIGSIDRAMILAAIAPDSGEADGAFLDGEEAAPAALGFDAPDALSLGTGVLGLFSATGHASPVFQAADGRRGAMSLERLIQGASLTAGRDREGPFPTRLFTNIDTVHSVPPVLIPESGYGADNARAEAARCIQCECMECVKNCVYLEEYGAYPKVYARQIYNNDSIVMGSRQSNTMINSCMLCGLCETICPEDFSMERLCLEARRNMVDKGRMPPSAHEFALRDMAFADGDQCALTRMAPGKNSCSMLFFPGCQLTASDPGAVERTYRFLLNAHPDMGLMLRCCGAPARWAGREADFARSLTDLAAQWEQLGSPELIVACPTCLKLLREGLPDAPIRSLWGMLNNEPGLVPKAVEGTLALHDPCGTRHDADLRNAVRALLAKAGQEITEPLLTGETTECCGFGGLLADANPPLGRKVAQRRAQSAPGDFVTYCAMCRDMLAKGGARISHMLDLCLPDPADKDPSARPAPGHSQRRENRARLRERLLKTLWNEDPAPDEPFEAIRVAFTPEASAIVEERRILVSDVQKVLFRARTTGRTFVSVQTGRLLAAHRPVNVTYWVEYEPDGEGYLVHNAWCHRMQVMGGMA
jgi:Fe-S oxidoreductase